MEVWSDKLFPVELDLKARGKLPFPVNSTLIYDGKFLSENQFKCLVLAFKKTKPGEFKPELYKIHQKLDPLNAAELSKELFGIWKSRGFKTPDNWIMNLILLTADKVTLHRFAKQIAEWPRRIRTCVNCFIYNQSPDSVFLVQSIYKANNNNSTAINTRKLLDKLAALKGLRHKDILLDMHLPNATEDDIANGETDSLKQIASQTERFKEAMLFKRQWQSRELKQCLHQNISNHILSKLIWVTVEGTQPFKIAEREFVDALGNTLTLGETDLVRIARNGDLDDEQIANWQSEIEKPAFEQFNLQLPDISKYPMSKAGVLLNFKRKYCWEDIYITMKKCDWNMEAEFEQMKVYKQFADKGFYAILIVEADYYADLEENNITLRGLTFVQDIENPTSTAQVDTETIAEVIYELEEINNKIDNPDSTVEAKEIATCGLDENGVRLFDYGPRVFEAKLQHDMSVIFTLGEKSWKTLPKPNKNDDPVKALNAKSDATDFKKEVKSVFRVEVRELENALGSGLKWEYPVFEEQYVKHPLMRYPSQEVVWGSYKDGKLIQEFRLSEELEYVDSDDEPVEIDKASRVGLVHPLEMENRDEWSEIFEDYELYPPFQQIDRPTFTNEIKAKGGYYDIPQTFKINPLSMFNILEKQGWLRNRPAEGGQISQHLRYFPNENITAAIDYDGAYVGALHHEDDKEVIRFLFKKGHHKPKEYNNLYADKEELKVSPIMLSEILYVIDLLRKKALELSAR